MKEQGKFQQKIMIIIISDQVHFIPYYYKKNKAYHNNLNPF